MRWFWSIKNEKKSASQDKVARFEFVGLTDRVQGRLNDRSHTTGLCQKTEESTSGRNQLDVGINFQCPGFDATRFNHGEYL